MVDRRTATTLMRFHPDERRRIPARARRCGQTPARFLREPALGALPTPRPDATVEPLGCELARFADAAQDAVLAARTSADRAGHRALVRQLVPAQGRAGRVAR
jgi:hypothetical protein